MTRNALIVMILQAQMAAAMQADAAARASMEQTCRRDPAKGRL